MLIKWFINEINRIIQSGIDLIAELVLFCICFIYMGLVVGIFYVAFKALKFLIML